MKRKQAVFCMLLSGMLALGNVFPVMAEAGKGAEGAAGVEMTPGNGNGQADDAKNQMEGGDAALPVDTGSGSPADQRATQNNNTITSLVSDDVLRSMSANLTTMADQSLAFYHSMSAEEQEAISKIAATEFNVPDRIDALKKKVTFDAMKMLIDGYDDQIANVLLVERDEKIISEIDRINRIMRDAKDYVSDRIAYQQLGLAKATKALQIILVKDRQIYTDEYIAQAQKYYDEAVTLTPGVQSYDYIIDFCNEVNMFLDEDGKHLNYALLDEAIRAADAFAAFLACAPDPAIANEKFNLGDGRVLTFGQIAGAVKSIAESMKQAGQVDYSDLSAFSSLIYGNLLEAYNGVSKAILSSMADQVKDAEYIGYTGDKKSAYDAALDKYNAAMAAKEYDALPGVVSDLRDAAKAYAGAAEEYAKAEGKKQIPELKDKLTGIQDEVKAYSGYYNDTYPTEVNNMVAAVEHANMDTMGGKAIMDLLNDAKAVIAKQGGSYSQKLKDTVSHAQNLTARAGEWWSLLPEQMQVGSPYREAIALTDALTNTIGGKTVYDLGALEQAYGAFVNDFHTGGGKIQTAAKAAAQYVLAHAEEVYGAESKNKHTDDLLKAYRDAIDNLKSSIAAWDFDGTRAAVIAVKNAEANLLNDKPVLAAQTLEKSAKTGDMSNIGGVAFLALASLTSAAGIFFKRRK